MPSGAEIRIIAGAANGFGYRPDTDAVERGRAHLDTSTSRAVDRGKLTQEDADALLGRITTTTS